MTESPKTVEPPFFKRSVQVTIAVLAIAASLWQGSVLSRRISPAREARHEGLSHHAGPPRHEVPSSAERHPLIQIDLNRAPSMELSLLPGVGPVLARRIVENRQRLGPFDSVDALARVHGIGSQKIEQIRPLGFVEPRGGPTVPAEPLSAASPRQPSQVARPWTALR